MKKSFLFLPCLVFFLNHNLLGQQAAPIHLPDADTVLSFPNSATGSLPASRFNRGNITDPIQLAQGKIAGLSISRPGSNPNGQFVTRVRGLSSRLSNTEPLIVLNGVPGANLNVLDPDDIVSFTVLKDASATAMYGMRGAAGIILVETRRQQPERLGIEYSAQVAFDKSSGEYEVFNAGDFIKAGGEDLSPNSNTNTDWQKSVLRTGISQAHGLRIDAPLGSGAVQAALHYRNADGIVQETGFKQYSAQVGIYQAFWRNRIRVSSGFLAAHRQADLGFPEAFRYAITFNPSAPLSSSDPQWANTGGYVQPLLFDYFNPLAIIEQNANRNRTKRWLAYLNTGVELFKGFYLEARIAQESDNTLTGEYYSPEGVYRNTAHLGAFRRIKGDQTSQYLEANGRYQFKLGALASIRLQGGYSWQQFDYEARDNTGSGVFGLTKNSDLSAFESLELPVEDYTFSAYSKGANTLAAFWGRAQMNIRDRYFVEAGLRREGSNRLGRNQKWGSFPFVSGGLDFSKILSVKKLERLYLRAGYGISGQQPSADGLSRQILTPSAFVYYNGAFIQGYRPATNENPDLKWEQKREFNIGIDIALPANKISASLDYYRQRSEDLIWRVNVPNPPNLANVTYLNAIEISGKGLEASLQWKNILNTEKTDWSASVVFSKYTIEVVHNGADEPYTLGSPGAPGMCCANYVLIRDGDPLGQLWGPVRNGVSNGVPVYEDIDRDGMVSLSSIEVYDQDQTLIGTGLPKFELGLQNDLKWRNLDLSIFFRGSFGHDLMNENRLFYENTASAAFTPYNRVLTKYFNPAITTPNRVENTNVEKASFFRLDNIALGYTFLSSDKKWLKKARVFIGGQNLFTITSYTGLDPEIRLADPGPTDNGARLSSAPEPFLPGIDRRGTYPPARTYFAGLNVSF